MTIQLLGVYVTAVVLLCLSPGPNSLLAITNSVRYGPHKALFSTLGCAAGLTLLIAACISGLGVIITASETIFKIIKWLGAGYLIYLGLMLLVSKHHAIATPQSSSCKVAPANKELFIQGFFIVVSNPKVLLFFSAFLPQFYSANAHFLPQFLVLAGSFIVVEIVLELLLARFADNIRNGIGSGNGIVWINRITGGLFVSAGAFLFTYERP